MGGHGPKRRKRALRRAKGKESERERKRAKKGERVSDQFQLDLNPLIIIMDGPRIALHNLRNLPGATKQAIRVGRGRSSRRPKTAGRGHKGAGQHASNRARLGFEGGQTPLYRRQPKHGFKNP